MNKPRNEQGPQPASGPTRQWQVQESIITITLIIILFRVPPPPSLRTEGCCMRARRPCTLLWLRKEEQKQLVE